MVELPSDIPRTEQSSRGLLKTRFCEMSFTGISVCEVRTIEEPFGYFVTPNVDHIVRNWRDGGQLARIDEEAELSLCDSRIVGLVAKLCGIKLSVVTGLDLTASLLDYLIDPDERPTIVGGSSEVVAKLA